MPDAGTDKLKIDTEEQYREALSEVPRVDSAQPGAPEFQRLHALRAALFDYEQRHLRPQNRPGRPRFSTGS